MSSMYAWLIQQGVLIFRKILCGFNFFIGWFWFGCLAQILTCMHITLHRKVKGLFFVTSIKFLFVKIKMHMHGVLNFMNEKWSISHFIHKKWLYVLQNLHMYVCTSIWHKALINLWENMPRVGQCLIYTYIWELLESWNKYIYKITFIIFIQKSFLHIRLVDNC